MPATHSTSAFATLRSAALLSAALAGFAATAASPAPAQQIISGPSPFQNCTADDVAGQPGTNYPNAEVEPWVDVNPTRLSNIVAGWQQDRWSNGGARSLMSAYSKNGGKNWTPVVVPGITLCSGGTYQRASDPWVSFGPYGDVYYLSLSFMNDLPNGGSGPNAILVNKSNDGGAHWGPPKTIIADTDPKNFNDKEMIKADPTNASYVYAAWDRLTDFTVGGNHHGEPGAVRHTSVRVNSVQAARERQQEAAARAASGAPAPTQVFYIGPSYFARSINGGASWQPARMIFDAGPNAQTIGNQVVVMPDGAVMDFYTNITQEGAVRMGFVKSSDHGAHFGAGVNAFDMLETNTGVLTPDAKEPVRDASYLFDIAVDPSAGILYAVWQDGRWGGVDKIAFSMSTNDGFSWSIPIQINLTPKSTLGRLHNQAFIPSIEVGPKHKLYVTYYDFRNDTASTTSELADVWSISCDPVSTDCRRRASWGSEQRLTDASYNELDAPEAGGHFLGDYQGLVRRGAQMAAVFVTAVGKDLTDVFFRQVQ